MSTFAEFASFTGYVQYAGQYVPGQPIPVLTPSEHWRLASWRKVFDWYDQNRAPGRSKVTPGKALIIAVSPEVVPMAELLARTISVEARIWSPSAPLDFSVFPAVPITFVGLVNILDTKFAIEAGRKLRVPWSLIVSYDLCGLSFVVAKSIALSSAEKVSGDTLLLDCIGGIARRYCLAKISLSQQSAVRQLLQDSFSNVVLHVHGEGAHADLGRIVLCGRLGEVERGADGKPIVDGCCTWLSEAFCKRGHDRIKVRTFQQLKAFRHILLTCNGYTPTGELYPSDLSCPLAALDGYAGEVITSTRAMSFASGFPSRIAGLAASRLTLEDAHLHATETAEMNGLEYAFVRLGCISEFREKGAQTNRVASVEPEESIAQPKSLSDAERKVWLVSQKLIALRSIVRHLELGSNARLEIYEAQSVVEDASTALAKAVRQGHQYSVAAETIQNLRQVLDLVVKNHDALLSKHLFDAQAEFDILGTMEQTASRSFVQQLERCERCGAPTELWRLSPLIYGGAEASEILCPICGHRDLSFLGQGKLEVVVDKFVSSGQAINVSVTRVDDGPIPRLQTGWLVTTLREKSQGKLLVHRRDPMRSETNVIQIDVPAEAPSDMLTVKILWIEELSLASLRRRVVCQRH